MIYIGIMLFAIYSVMKDCLSIVDIGSHCKRVKLEGNMSRIISRVINTIILVLSMINNWENKNNYIKNNYQRVDLSTTCIKSDRLTSKQGKVNPRLYPPAIVCFIHLP